MILKTKSRVPKEIEITIPCFFRMETSLNINWLVGVLDEKTCIVVFQGQDSTVIRSSTPTGDHHELMTAINEWSATSETDFLEAHKIALTSLSLEPELNHDDLKELDF